MTRTDFVAYGHMDPDKSAVLDELAYVHRPAADGSRDPVAQVGRAGKGHVVAWVTRQNVERATADTRIHAIFDAIMPRNIVLVPVTGGDYVIVAAISDTPRRFFDDDLEFLTMLARRIAPMLY